MKIGNIDTTKPIRGKPNGAWANASNIEIVRKLNKRDTEKSPCYAIIFTFRGDETVTTMGEYDVLLNFENVPPPKKKETVFLVRYVDSKGNKRGATVTVGTPDSYLTYNKVALDRGDEDYYEFLGEHTFEYEE